MNCNTIITKINKYLKIRKIKITILNPATIKSDYLSCEVIRCSDDGVSHICDLTGCGKASGRNFIGQLSAFCLIKAAVHIGIYDTAGYGIYRNMRWRKLLAECLGKCIYRLSMPPRRMLRRCPRQRKSVVYGHIYRQPCKG